MVFLKLAARYVNDDSPKCIKFVSLALQKLFQTTTDKAHLQLLKVSTDWLKTDNESTRVIGYFVIIEFGRGLSSLVVTKLSNILPLLAHHLAEISTINFTETVVLALFETLKAICELLPNAFLETFIPLAKANELLGKSFKFF